MPIALREVDELKITTLMDNTVDLLMASTSIAKRFTPGPGALERGLPIAEHGFSALVSVREGDRWRAVLFDTGSSPTGILHNLDAMQVDTSQIEAIVLSHGHYDHTLGLPKLLDRLSGRTVQVVAHPDAFLPRRRLLADGTTLAPPYPDRAVIQRQNVELIESKGPTMLLDGALVASGEIARTTDFEKGMPGQQAMRNGAWQPDPMFYDDQCLVASVRGKGLALIFGCGHAGMVNTVRHVRALTEVSRIHVLLGGFHLTDPQTIGPSITELKVLNPHYIVPTHCTSFAAIHDIANALPSAFIPNSVGTTFTF